MRRYWLILWAMLAPASLTVPAQTVGNWDAVRQFAASQAIRVSLADGRGFQGKFQSATDGELLLSTAKAQETLARADITRVATKGTNHRVRNAVIGLGVGAGAGLGVGAIVDHESACKQPGGCFLHFNNLGKAVFTPIGAVAGLIVGALIPSGNWHDVYRTK
jgi:hypothetical protein